MEDYKKGMGKRIREMRKQLKYTQEDMAEKLDISVKHFSEVERGLTGLSIENLIKLSNIFNTSIDYIITGNVCDDPWFYFLSSLRSVPKEKEKMVKDVISGIINLSNNNSYSE